MILNANYGNMIFILIITDVRAQKVCQFVISYYLIVKYYQSLLSYSIGTIRIDYFLSSLKSPPSVTNSDRSIDDLQKKNQCLKFLRAIWYQFPSCKYWINDVTQWFRWTAYCSHTVLKWNCFLCRLHVIYACNLLRRILNKINIFFHCAKDYGNFLILLVTKT